MQPFLWSMLSIAAYVGGMIILIRVTPRLILRSYEEGWFMGFAALDILGALLAFGAIVIMLAASNGAVLVKVFDFVLLLGILLVALRLAFFSLRAYIPGAYRVSRIGVAVFSLFLVTASVYYMIQLFVA